MAILGIRPTRRSISITSPGQGYTVHPNLVFTSPRNATGGCTIEEDKGAVYANGLWEAKDKYYSEEYSDICIPNYDRSV